MKILKKTIHRQYKQEVELKITNVIHDLPTWMFPEFTFGGSLKNPCPICHKEMRLNIAHGQYIEKCSMIQVDGFDTYPIHTKCYNEITDVAP
jgi:hypothetical protein